MAANINKTKRRINSINSTKKITNAMELVATVKLKKFKNVLLSNSEYVNEIDSITNLLLTSSSEQDFIHYVKGNNTNKKLFIIINSNLGLCASFNNDIFKYSFDIISKNDDLIYPIGLKGYKFYKSNKFNVDNNYITLNDKINYQEIMKMAFHIIDLYDKGEVSEVNVVYTKYVNSIKFCPDIYKIFPFAKTNKNNTLVLEPLFEPNAGSLIKNLLPLYTASVLYKLIIESQVSEQASRRTAMENATDNATDLINNLTVEYNKARQAAITAEISEVVSANIK